MSPLQLLKRAALLALVSSCGSCGSAADGASPDAAVVDGGATTADAPATGEFSFFVTSLETMRTQSGNQDGFGGDLGGLSGADQICQRAAAEVGFGHRTWRAFLSVTNGPDGGPVNAIDRVGAGPWFDRNRRLVATGREGLLGIRPDGDERTINDLPDEHGVPLSILGDAHDILTGSDGLGRLASTGPVSTCSDWTSAVGEGSEGKVMCGHSFPRAGKVGYDWISDHPVPGCAPGINLIQNGPGQGNCVGCGGGYGGIYCFAVD